MDVSTVNLSNDTIWVWGSLINSTNQYIPQALYTYDFKNDIWYSQYSLSGSGRVYHTVTLGRNEIIYILGGYFQSDQVSSSQYANFSQVLTFDTKSSQWLIINSTGDQPSNRILHSTTQISNSDLLVIYGGIQLENNRDFATDDICYIYDSINNSFKKVMLPSNINRVGHFATMYGTNYLILVFGFIGFNLPADNLSVLNMTDMYNPTWLTSFNATLHVENINKLDQSSIIAIIVVFIVFFFVALFGIIFYIRYRKMKQKKTHAYEKNFMYIMYKRAIFLMSIFPKFTNGIVSIKKKIIEKKKKENIEGYNEKEECNEKKA
ncbi:hypothetical protein BJ944DRAFT_274761 [Cunninghamella echinulata]|nr:hypothetical protein BJ944DRAFT_274761 [Cunninghamella echinulata]